jgi:putative ABC transport system ATP-binding protein
MLVQAKELARIYTMGETEVRALDGVSFHIERGDYVAIIGPSGSGKSTLMHLLGCLDKPTSGSYVLDGTPIETLDDQQLSMLRNQKVGFIFQSFNLIQQLTVAENVEVPLIYMGVPRSERRDYCVNMLELVGLGHRVNHRPNELSGGENQRVAVARALVTQPDIILADEPTGNLDTKTGTEIMELLQELNRQGKTVILVTHDLEKAAWTKRLIQMKDGKIVRIITGEDRNHLIELFHKVPQLN